MNPEARAGHDPAPAPAERQPRPRVAKGPSRPQYLHALDNDKLVMMVTALASEVSALRDRLLTHEALADQALPAKRAAVEAYVAGADEAAHREAERMALLKRVYRVVTDELEAQRRGPTKVWQTAEDWERA